MTAQASRDASASTGLANTNAGLVNVSERRALHVESC